MNAAEWNKNEPAAPVRDQDVHGQARQWWGLTKREQFAAMAMQGMVVSDTWVSDSDAPEIARRCVVLADALLVQLAENGGESPPSRSGSQA